MAGSTSGGAAIVCFFAVLVIGFPAHASGIGSGPDVGRLGTTGSPIVAGDLFDYSGQDELFVVLAIMSIGSVIAVLLWIMPIRDVYVEAMMAELASNTNHPEPAQ